MNNKEAQTKLIELGLLDPPADGLWGNYSKLALRLFQDRSDLEVDGELNAKTKDTLANAKVLPLVPTNTLCYQVARYMEREGMFLARSKGLVNIAYLEGVSTDGKLNADRIDEWNDVRLCFEIVDSEVIELGRWRATTEPGKYWVENRRGNPKGAARIAFGQYKAWRVGMHNNSHQALVQTGGAVTVHRDFNADGFRTGDKLDTGFFGINQHHGWNMAKVGRASAGCLVGQSKTGQMGFMAVCKSDLRYRVNQQYIFYTAICDGSKVLR